MNAVSSMGDLCLEYDGSRLISHTWSLPQYDINVDIIASGNALYAAWGIQTMVEALVDTGFWPTYGVFHWQGRLMGQISIDHRKSSEARMVTESTAIHPGLVDAPTNNSATLFSLPTVKDHVLQMQVRYSGVDVSVRQIFSTVLSVMVLGKEQGPDNLCPGINNDDFEMMPQKDLKTGLSRLKWVWVVKAARFLANWMTEEGEYGEANIDIVRDGTLVAQGRIRKPFGIQQK